MQCHLPCRVIQQGVLFFLIFQEYTEVRSLGSRLLHPGYSLLQPMKFAPVQKASTDRIIQVYVHQSQAALNTPQGGNMIHCYTSLGRASQALWNTPEMLASPPLTGSK